MSYPQANVPSRRGPGSFLQNAVDARNLDVRQPTIKTSADGIAVTVFEDEVGVAIRAMQNCCAFPVKYAINQTVTANSFHGILAACSATDDGLGSYVDLSKFRGYVSVLATGGALRLATFIAYNPERQLAP